MDMRRMRPPPGPRVESCLSCDCDTVSMVFEHGIGGSQDLPIPLSLALAGGAAALAISFIVLAIAWRNPHYDASVDGRPLPGALARALDGGWLSVLLRVVGFVFTAYVVWAAV